MVRSGVKALGVVLPAVLVAARLVAQAPTSPPTPISPQPLPSDSLFDNTTLHAISLTINSRDWQSLIDNYLDNTYYPADVTVNTAVVRNVGIRSRGNGSRSGTKPGLKVDFNHYTTSQTFLGLKAFVLRNQTQDASNMHEPLSMLIYRRLGVWAPREAYTKLFVNNVYAGLYVIVDEVDNTFLLNSFGENGGNLYSYDYATGDLPWYFEYRGDDPNTYVPKPFKPETNTTDPKPTPLRDWIRTVDTDSDAAFPTTITSYFPTWDNFIKHIAVENFVTDLDGFNGDYGINNFYVYRWANTTQLTFIPWDKSEAFKATPNGSLSPGNPALGIFHNFLDGDPAKRNRLSGRAMTLDVARNLYLDTLLTLASMAKALDPQDPADTRGWLEREIDREYALIKDAVYADTKRPFTTADFETDVENLRNYARVRPDNVTTQVNNFRAGR